MTLEKSIFSPAYNLSKKGFYRGQREGIQKELSEADLERVYMIVDVTEKGLGGQVKTARGIQGLLGTELVAMLGVSSATLTGWEKDPEVINTPIKMSLLNFINGDY